MTRLKPVGGVILALACTFSPIATAVGATTAAAAAPADDRPALSISRLSDETVTNGMSLQFVGRGPQRTVGRRVVLQRRVASGDWLTVSRRKIAADRRLLGAGTATGAGANSWRFMVRARNSRVFLSPTIRTTVYNWFYLADRYPVDDDDAYDGSATIGGRTFGKSLLMTHYENWSVNEGWSEFNLSYRCIRLATEVGVEDSSDSGSRGNVWISLDGSRVWSGDVALGPATPVVIDTTSRLRVRLSSMGTSGTDMDLVFGDPRVLCSGRPG